MVKRKEQKRRLNVRVDVDSPIWNERNMSETTRKALDFYYTFWGRTVFALNKIEFLLDKIEKMERSGFYGERDGR
ncbi:hypothetical protein M2349_000321 [Caldanaerobacter subterraneus subsp. tengcongensis MB4]|uniref:Uncharacterized protein n=1 Tax=Caldanaerobacter subterraneus subsp. tengcongensis (strain DSM 15242 / JCM 11007 / NBRC 100824 / MB4) TaxID=273068 RepID=Q8R8F5_CALS4|nr:hypothetical protein [Caldanaerobacter subterraneus]AAM25223.1 hypothetical protein TTE2049 [Caldanaerobacter subterraneus subsp. tengcongensis MB4]MCS3915180.1 hypothetical protein [Caldanaerobacter subterraneus subsp. tengcongensis MB4]